MLLHVQKLRDSEKCDRDPGGHAPIGEEATAMSPSFSAACGKVQARLPRLWRALLGAFQGTARSMRPACRPVTECSPAGFE